MALITSPLHAGRRGDPADDATALSQILEQSSPAQQHQEQQPTLVFQAASSSTSSGAPPPPSARVALRHPAASYTASAGSARLDVAGGAESNRDDEPDLRSALRAVAPAASPTAGTQVQQQQQRKLVAAEAEAALVASASPTLSMFEPPKEREGFRESSRPARFLALRDDVPPPRSRSPSPSRTNGAAPAHDTISPRDQQQQQAAIYAASTPATLVRGGEGLAAAADETLLYDQDRVQTERRAPPVGTRLNDAFSAAASAAFTPGGNEMHIPITSARASRSRSGSPARSGASPPPSSASSSSSSSSASSSAAALFTPRQAPFAPDAFMPGTGLGLGTGALAQAFSSPARPAGVATFASSPSGAVVAGPSLGTYLVPFISLLLAGASLANECFLALANECFLGGFVIFCEFGVLGCWSIAGLSSRPDGGL